MNGKKSKLGLGVALLIIGYLLFTSKLQERVSVLGTSFEGEPVEVRGLDDSGYDGSLVPQRIVIPKLSLDLEVREAKIINGYWEVFAASGAWGSGSGLPGQVGNQVIFAHAKEGLFLPLKNAKIADIIYVLTPISWYKYEVSEIKEVMPNQTEIIAPTNDETLTLYTCSGFRDTKRLIIIAKRAI